MKNEKKMFFIFFVHDPGAPVVGSMSLMHFSMNYCNTCEICIENHLQEEFPCYWWKKYIYPPFSDVQR